MKILIDKMRKYIASLEKWDIGLLVICLGFYLFFPFYDGPVWCKDSPSYASMNITREPLYPTFLWMFRSLFSEEKYLLPVVIVQSLLAAYATWKLAVSVRRYGGGSKVLSFFSMGFQFGVTLLCRFVAIRGSSYIDSIMTEGLGLSLYVLFMIQLYQYILSEKKRNLAGAAIYALLLVNLRKQMLITLCLLLALFILYYFIKKRNARKLLLLFGLVVCLFFAGKLTDRFYNYLVRGVWIEHSGNSMGMLCTLIYTADETDRSLFEEEETAALFTEILRQAEEQGLRISYAPSGWVELSSHYADSYDPIGYGIINPVIQGHIAQNYEYSEIGAVLKYDEYCNEMTAVLAGQEKGDLFRVYLANTWKGFVNSIARVNQYLNYYAVFAYLIFLGGYLFLCRKGRSWKEPDGVLTFAELVLGGIIINSMVVGAMIFCQPRYMIYNMGLFYSALSMLIYDCIRMGKQK